VSFWSYRLSATRGDRKRTRLLQRAQLKYSGATLEDATFEGVRGIDGAALMAVALSSRSERGETLTFAVDRPWRDLAGLCSGAVRLAPPNAKRDGPTRIRVARGCISSDHPTSIKKPGLGRSADGEVAVVFSTPSGDTP
jgi:hypothetical protein